MQSENNCTRLYILCLGTHSLEHNGKKNPGTKLKRTGRAILPCKEQRGGTGLKLPQNKYIGKQDTLKKGGGQNYKKRKRNLKLLCGKRPDLKKNFYLTASNSHSSNSSFFTGTESHIKEAPIWLTRGEENTDPFPFKVIITSDLSRSVVIREENR